MFKLFSFNSFYYHVVNGHRGPNKTGVPVGFLWVVLYYAEKSGETYWVEEFYVLYLNKFPIPLQLDDNNQTATASAAPIDSS